MWDLDTLRKMNGLVSSEQSQQENARYTEKFLVVGSARKDYLDVARNEITKKIEEITRSTFKATRNSSDGIEHMLKTQQVYMEMDGVNPHGPYSGIGTNMGFGGFNFGIYYRATQPAFGQEIEAIVRDAVKSPESKVINLSHVIRHLNGEYKVTK